MSASWPLPNTSDPLAAPYWAAAEAGRLSLQRCAACGYVRWPIARSCPECLVEGGDWVALSGRGEIWSFAVYEQPLHPAFEAICPYAVGLIRLNEGPVIHARLLDPPSTLACGQAVQAEFTRLAPGVSVPVFRRSAPDVD